MYPMNSPPLLRYHGGKIATDWAWQQKVKPASAKLVLLALALCADESLEFCPSIDELSNYTGLNRKTIFNSIHILSEMSLLRKERRCRRDNGNLTNKYKLEVIR